MNYPYLVEEIVIYCLQNRKVCRLGKPPSPSPLPHLGERIRVRGLFSIFFCILEVSQ